MAVGQRVKWSLKSGGKLLFGVVTSYDHKSGLHTVQFANGDRSQHDLAKNLRRVVVEVAEDVQTSASVASFSSLAYVTHTATPQAVPPSAPVYDDNDDEDLHPPNLCDAFEPWQEGLLPNEIAAAMAFVSEGCSAEGF